MLPKFFSLFQEQEWVEDYKVFLKVQSFFSERNEVVARSFFEGAKLQTLHLWKKLLAVNFAPMKKILATNFVPLRKKLFAKNFFATNFTSSKNFLPLKTH